MPSARVKPDKLSTGTLPWLAEKLRDLNTTERPILGIRQELENALGEHGMALYYDDSVKSWMVIYEETAQY